DGAIVIAGRRQIGGNSRDSGKLIRTFERKTIGELTTEGMASGEYSPRVDSMDRLFMGDDRFNKGDIVDSQLFCFAGDPLSARVPAAADSIRICHNKPVLICKHVKFEPDRFPDQRAVAASAVENENQRRTSVQIRRHIQNIAPVKSRDLPEVNTD